MMNNAGGAWDNSKKWVENDHPEIIQGVPVMKGSDHHAAVVTGDTVGDPFKDTSGPALNILIKLMSVLSLTCGGLFRDDWDTWWVGVIVLIVEVIVCVAIYKYVNSEEIEEYDEKYLFPKQEGDPAAAAAAAAAAKADADAKAAEKA